MRPVVRTLTGAGVSTWIPVDYRQAPFEIGIGVALSAGANLTYSVEHTFDNIQDPSVTPKAHCNEGLTSKTASDDGNYAFPVRAVRLAITTYTTGEATMTLLQGQR
jgi:hypothetical protein